MSNIFDRIFKEDIEVMLEVFAKNILHVEMAKTIELKDKIQTTWEREGDFLKKLVFDDPSKDCVLHIEFHVKDENLTKWMLMTYGMIYFEFDVPVKQFVIYVGRKKKPKMPFQTSHDNCKHLFTVINLREFSYKIFLESSIPELIVLTVLSDFEGERAEVMIREILNKLTKLKGNKIGLDKYLYQLEILSKLRNLQQLTVKTINAMPIVYDLKSDVRFKQGKEEGIEEGIEKGIEKNKIETIQKILATKKFTDEQIADLLEVSISFVRKIKKELSKGRNKQNTNHKSL
jgi:predicted transposase YdaD